MSKKLKDRFDLVVNEYTKKFAKKHGIEFDFWVCDEAGEMACFSEWYYIHFSTIKYDIDNDISNRIFLDWFNLHMAENNGYNISYKNYVRGLRPEHIIESERRELLELSKMNVERSKEILENLIKETE